MKVSKFTTYRSEGRGINQTDNCVRVTIDCSVNEFNRYFRNDTNLKNIEVAETAIEACKTIDKFHSKCMTGHPIELVSNGKNIDHALLNLAYDFAFKVLHQLEDNNES